MNDRDPRVIGARIARRRHQLGWSQVELAGHLGVSPSSVANWERGASYPKKKLGKVEQVLGISLLEPEGEVADRSPPARLSDETRVAIRRDLAAEPDLAEWVIDYVEGLASGRIRPAGSDPQPQAAARRPPGRA